MSDNDIASIKPSRNEGIKTPQVPMLDVTSVNAVQSLFLDGPKDPWAPELTANFIDFFIWNDLARYPLILPAEQATQPRAIELPSLFRDIMRRDSKVFSEEIYISEEQIELLPELIAPMFSAFADYAENNKTKLRQFLALHHQSWIREQLTSRASQYGGYFYRVLLKWGRTT